MIFNFQFNMKHLLLIFWLLSYSLCAQQNTKLLTGAEQSEIYLPLLSGKNVGLVVNQTSMAANVHLVDYLVSKNISVKRIFAPEHGFRGTVDRGADFDNSVDNKTKIPIVAMYGKNKRPTVEQLQDLDVLIFDIQDVGVRFYTYISSLHEVMQACADRKKKLLVFDRPNPNGWYIDGCVLDPKFSSFVGKHPIPIVHGLTIGELALMINGEKWLDAGIQCDVRVVEMQNYSHKTRYSLPVKPSPNLTNDLSIMLYPSLCLFEATKISVGRGTEFPFQVIGYPDKQFGEFTFTPKSIKNMETKPLHDGLSCFGVDLRNLKNEQKFTLKYFIDFYKKWNFTEPFISDKRWFNLLAGNNLLIKQIEDGLTEEQIKATWNQELTRYKAMRKKYLLYSDFE